MSERSAQKNVKFERFCAVHIIGHLIILYNFKNVHSFLQKSYEFDIFLSKKYSNKNPLAEKCTDKRIFYLYVFKEKVYRVLYPCGARMVAKRRMLGFGNIVTEACAVTVSAPNANLVRDLLFCKRKRKL